MIKTKVTKTRALKFLKNQLKVVKSFKYNPPVVRLGKPNLGRSYEEMLLSRKVRLVRQGSKMVLVLDTSSSVPNEDILKIYRTLEYGTSGTLPKPISPALRRHVERYVIPHMIAEMRKRLG